jgi:hypothetical protein
MARYLQVLSKILVLLIGALFVFYSCKKKDTESVSIEEAIFPPDNNKSVGKSANDILSNDNYSELRVEINYAEGSAVTQQTLKNLQSFLNEITQKQTITIIQSPMPTIGGGKLSTAQLIDLEKEHRTQFTREGSISVHVLLLDAGSSADNGSSTVLGVAYKNTSIALFMDNIDAASDALNQTEIESTVMHHEFGHLFGLVDVGTPMQIDHKDRAHGSHCLDSKCLMYYAVESGDFISTLVGSGVPTFDNNCVNDILAQQGL